MSHATLCASSSGSNRPMLHCRKDGQRRGSAAGLSKHRSPLCPRSPTMLPPPRRPERRHGAGPQAQGSVRPLHGGPPEAGHAGAAPPRPPAAARAGRGRLEDQRSATRIRCRSSAERRSRLLVTGMCAAASRCVDARRRYRLFSLTFSGLRAKVRHYAAGAMVLCSIAPADGTYESVLCCNAEVRGPGRPASATLG